VYVVVSDELDEDDERAALEVMVAAALLVIESVLELAAAPEIEVELGAASDVVVVEVAAAASGLLEIDATVGKGTEEEVLGADLRPRRT